MPLATSKAQIKATNKYIGKAYDRLNIVIPKGRKADVEAFVAKENEGSINSVVNDLLRDHIGMDDSEWKAKPEAQEAGDPNG